ncbi:TolC family protein [Mucilaginibacter aquariorum]|uniref:TolC family protein n=1 Tax=Mucilaginibacter aquariorum TaxID=2967225 RepID=A0ABT1T8X5_9SPHI|nr:TolC family protein [Mucilaginibacter aquariorum]MCQ6961064.1 TolC family protein [Mucilaginibacter aquariorum]
MKNAGSYIVTLLLMLSSASSLAQDTSHLDLQTIFRKIETSYPEILKYDSKIKSIQAQEEGAKSWMPPTFSLGLDRFPYDLKMLNSKDDPMNQAGVMFSVEQMIPNSAKLNAKKDYINSLASVQQSNANWTKNILRSNAKLLYYQRYVAEKKLKTIAENLQLLQLFIATAEERYKYNQSDLSTIYKAQAKTTDLKNMKSMLLSQVAESNIGLNILMNRDINTVFDIDTSITVNNNEKLPSADSAVINRSDITSMQNSITSMTLNKKYMSTSSRPDFGFKVQHMQMFGMPNQFSLMGMVTIPIVPWASKMYRSEVKSMEYEISSMQKEKETMQLMAKRMSSEKLSMLKFEKDQLKNYEREIIPSYQKNLQTSLLAYKQNTGSFFILLDAWEMKLMKQMEYLNKLNNVLQLQAEYEFEIEKK